MKITCPECGFSREMPADRLPSGTAIATCPKCSCRFRFSAANGAMEIMPPKGWRQIKIDKEEPQEEEDIRQVAKRAYEREAARFQTEPRPAEAPNENAAENPWALAPGKKGWIAAFFQTCARVMFSAPAFFGGLKSGGSQTRPLIFYAIICVFQTVIERLWGKFFYSLIMSESLGDPELEKVLALLSPESNFALALIMRCGVLILQLYVFAFLMAMAYKLVAPEKATFNLIFQVYSYSSAPAMLCVVPALGTLVGAIWGLGCLVVGCKAALKISWTRTLVGFLPLLVLIAPIVPQLLTALGR